MSTIGSLGLASILTQLANKKMILKGRNIQESSKLDDEALIWVCVEPIVQKVRGKDPVIKSQVVMQLNTGQRALFLFQVLHGHANNGIL